MSGSSTLRPFRKPVKPALTERERGVLKLVARGMTDAQIAAHLTLSSHTVHRHVANIRTKLGVPSRAAAAASLRTGSHGVTGAGLHR